jgi:hypothetical protein
VCSELEKILARRAAAQTVELDRIEAKLAKDAGEGGVFFSVRMHAGRFRLAAVPLAKRLRMVAMSVYAVESRGVGGKRMQAGQEGAHQGQVIVDV